MTQALRPLSFNEILDRTFALYRREFSLFVGIACIFYLPFGVVSTVAMHLVAMKSPAHGAPPDVAALLLLMVVVFVSLALLATGLLFAQGCLAIAIAERYLDRPITLGDALGRAMRRTPTLLLVAVLVDLMVVGGTFLCIVPGIMLLVALALAPQVAVIEGVPASQAVKRSMALTKGDRWRVFGILVLLGLVSTALNYGVMFGVTLTSSSELAGQLAGQVVSTILTPIGNIALVLVYFDNRVKKEGYDLALMAAELTRQPVPSAAA
jgi:hypothetical protein